MSEVGRPPEAEDAVVRWAPGARQGVAAPESAELCLLPYAGLCTLGALPAAVSPTAKMVVVCADDHAQQAELEALQHVLGQLFVSPAGL